LLIDGTDGFANPQAGPRVTVMGRIAATAEDALGRRFLARHPAARAYAGFGDFAFYAMSVERLHYVGGFARARWLDKSVAVLPAEMCTDLAQHEQDILAHMNNDHAEALALYGTRLLKARGRRFELVAVDPEGFDLRCGRSLRRIDFAKPVSSLSEVRAAFVDLAHQARALAR
jgi:heme iron utilization protein